jgi:hypothetical protein
VVVVWFSDKLFILLAKTSTVKKILELETKILELGKYHPPQMPKKSSIYIPQKFPKILIFNGFSMWGKSSIKFWGRPQIQYGNLGFEYLPKKFGDVPKILGASLKSKKNDIFYMNKNSYRCTDGNGIQQHAPEHRST